MLDDRSNAPIDDRRTESLTAASLPDDGHARASPVQRITLPTLLLVVLVAFSALVRAVLAREIPVPFIFGDELLHGELARGVEEHGGYIVRGHSVTISFLYPLALAPAWLAHSTETVYGAMKTVNAVLMSLAAVPVYVWARRFLSAWGALAAAALTLLLPGLVLTGTLMTENALFPAFLVGLLAVGYCVERPTLGRQALAAGGIALAGSARLQGLILVAVLPAAVVAERLLARRPSEVAHALVRLWPLGALVGATALIYVSAKLAAGGRVGALGVYSGQAPTHYSVWGVLRWTAYALGELALTTALVPFAAFLLLLMLAPRTREERAFLATGAAAILALVVLAGFAAFWSPPGLKDRYLFHAIPVLLLGLLLWFERGLPRPRVQTAAATLVAVVLVAILPLGILFESPALLGNGLGLVPFHRVAGAFGGTGQLRLWVLLGAVVLGLMAVLAPRRLAPAVLAAPIVLLLVLSSASLFHAMRAQARGVRDLAALGPHPQWIDAQIGGSARATYVNATQYEPEESRGDWWPLWVPVWESELFNRSLDASLSLGLREPLPASQVDGRLDWASGRITAVAGAAPAPRYAVSDPRFAVAGRRLAATPWLVLSTVQQPLRLDSAVEGVYRDGWSGTRAAYNRWTPSGDRVEVTVSRRGWVGGPAGKVTVAAGPLASQGGGALLGGETAEQVVRVPADATRVVEVPVPKAPYRIEVSSPDTFFDHGGRRLGARVSFRPVSG
jgi:hypothetical protein